MEGKNVNIQHVSKMHSVRHINTRCTEDENTWKSNMELNENVPFLQTEFFNTSKFPSKDTWKRIVKHSVFDFEESKWQAQILILSSHDIWHFLKPYQFKNAQSMAYFSFEPITKRTGTPCYKYVCFVAAHVL